MPDGTTKFDWACRPFAKASAVAQGYGGQDAVAYDVQNEMSVYFRLLALYRLPAGKHTGILTHFQTKVKKKKGKKISHRAHRGFS